jgi:hypothetical protein
MRGTGCLQVVLSIRATRSAKAARTSDRRVLNTLLFEMKRRGVSKGVATPCIGGGRRRDVRRSNVNGTEER